MYHDAADELKGKIITFRERFSSFDEILTYLYDEMVSTTSIVTGQKQLASFRRETPILQKTLLAQQRFQGVSEPWLIFNGVAQAIVVAGSGIECGRAPLM